LEIWLIWLVVLSRIDCSDDDVVNLIFKHHTFLVTGASSGIGRAVAFHLARLGARVLLNGRREEALAAILAALPGQDHAALPCPLGDLEEVAQWVKGVALVHGTLSGIVHCAGLQQALPIKVLKHRHFEETMRVNVEAGLGLIKGFRQKGVHVEGGSVVLMASIMGMVGQPLQSIYSASKGAIIALTRSTALELAKDGLRVNCVAPAIVETEMVERLKSMMTPEQFQLIVAAHPLGLGRVEDVANAVAFLLGDTARWITGTTLVLDGGYSAQ
jgi:NAD(P)-dependent dehydrogenase (short-subunit alcohol dehydrogenase family)